LNFRRVRRKILDSARNDDILLLTPQEGLPLSSAVAPNFVLTSSGKKFMSVVSVSPPFTDSYILIFQLSELISHLCCCANFQI
jgi:hypothetical protein